MAFVPALQTLYVAWAGENIHNLCRMNGWLSIGSQMGNNTDRIENDGGTDHGH
jgi:hypothetical protein